MSDSEARLGYGYLLGGPDVEWEFAGASDDYGYAPLEVFDWFDDDSLDSFGDCVESQLLTASGFTETDWEADSYFERERAAKEALGVEVLRFGSEDSWSYALIAKGSKQRVEWGAEYAELTVPAGADDRLSWALTALAWIPKQAGPRWIVGSFYG